MIVQERDRLNKALADISAKQEALNAEAAAIRKELSAVDAYERAKSGKPAVAKTTGGRAARGSRQETLLSLIAGNPDGMTRGDILTNLGVKGDKAAEGSISNALNTMKKAGKLSSKDGKYIAA